MEIYKLLYLIFIATYICVTFLVKFRSPSLVSLWSDCKYIWVIKVSAKIPEISTRYWELTLIFNITPVVAIESKVLLWTTTIWITNETQCTFRYKTCDNFTTSLTWCYVVHCFLALNNPSQSYKASVLNKKQILV